MPHFHDIGFKEEYENSWKSTKHQNQPGSQQYEQFSLRRPKKRLGTAYCEPLPVKNWKYSCQISHHQYYRYVRRSWHSNGDRKFFACEKQWRSQKFFTGGA